MAKIIKRTRKQVLKNWITALRSGKYKQAEDALRTDKGFCCLGVLCDLARKDGGDKWEHGWDGFSYKDENGTLPFDIEQFIFKDNKELSNELISMNDGGYSFKEIADKIEKELL